MDDLENIPEAGPPDQESKSHAPADPLPDLRNDVTSNLPGDILPAAETQAELLPARQFAPAVPPIFPSENAASRKRTFRQNLLMLLSLSLAAFILTAWILIRVDFGFGMFSTGPQEVARAQLRALDRGEVRPAYDMFSPRYRREVSYDVWHEVIVTHWRMFHSEVLRAGEPSQDGPRATLELYVRGADAKTYRARFTLVRLEGRWWIDDLHWSEDGRESDLMRS